jgi:hypothetical protein
MSIEARLQVAAAVQAQAQAVVGSVILKATQKLVVIVMTMTNALIFPKGSQEAALGEN